VSTHNWPIAEAKAKFSELLEQAEKCGPQIITRHGKRKGVLVSAEKWDELTKPKESLVEFFMNSPLRGANIEFERMRGKVRPVKF
jgi:prevent-host-death family protein